MHLGTSCSLMRQTYQTFRNISTTFQLHMNTVIKINIITLFYSEYRESPKKDYKRLLGNISVHRNVHNLNFHFTIHIQQFDISKPTLNRHFYVNCYSLSCIFWSASLIISSSLFPSHQLMNHTLT